MGVKVADKCTHLVLVTLNLGPLLSELENGPNRLFVGCSIAIMVGFRDTALIMNDRTCRIQPKFNPMKAAMTRVYSPRKQQVRRKTKYHTLQRMFLFLSTTVISAGKIFQIFCLLTSFYRSVLQEYKAHQVADTFRPPPHASRSKVFVRRKTFA